MPLSAGTRLGPFEIVAPLGEGGMGEVYRAADTRLNREVALKVLPDAFALDRDRLARFDREAQAVAALNHPNVARLYGLEELAGRKALVLELVEGPTLAERMAAGAIPQDEAIGIAQQIADALEAAHERGIVHRDLKPANVKLRADGVVKVLDFGLARLTDASGSAHHDPTLSPTITSPAMTGMGVILGTAAYMSPEQAAGKPADKRADIWSFGVVLWELLAGERLFAGESTSYVLADVLRSPINFEKIPAGSLRELVQRCLDRDVKTRLRDIGEARIALSRPPAAAGAPIASSRRASHVWAAAAAAVAISIGVTEWAPWRAEPERPLVHLPVDLGDDVTLPSTTSQNNVAISPDETRLVYAASVAGGPTRLYVRRQDTGEVIELPGSDSAHAAAFSPDSKSVVFLAGNSVFRVSSDGGAAQRLAATDSNTQVTWGDNDTIVVSGWFGLRRIPAAGGAMTKLTETDTTISHIHPQAHVLPGGKTVLFLSGRGGSDVTSIEAVSISGGDRKIVLINAGAPHYLPTGHLLYLRQGTLFAQRFDPKTLLTTGDAVPMVTDVRTTMQGLIAAGTFSVGNRTLVYRRATPGIVTGAIPGPRPAIVEWIDPSGKRSPLITSVGRYSEPRLLPDGRQLLLTDFGPLARGRVADVLVYDRQRELMTPLTVSGLSAGAVWVPPDNRLAVFLQAQIRGDGAGWLHGVPASGGQPELLLPDVPLRSIGSFSSDGKRLTVVRSSTSPGRGPGQAQRNILIVPITQDGGKLKAGTPEPFSPPQADEFAPEFSPDNRWIAFVTTRTGQEEVWVRQASAPSADRAETKISTSGGNNPRWLGKDELLYQSGDQIMSVRYAIAGDRFTIPGKAQLRVGNIGGPWDVTRDGRIAVIKPVEAAKGPPPDRTVMFVQNFADEVRRRVK